MKYSDDVSPGKKPISSISICLTKPPGGGGEDDEKGFNL